MYQSLKFKIQGVVPLLMHNGKLANPMNPIVKTMKKITAKGSRKTDEDLELLSKLEWLGGIYLTKSPAFEVEGFDLKIISGGELCLPDTVLESAIIGGAKKFKLGVAAKAGMMISGDFPINLGSTKTFQQIYDDSNHWDLRPVKVGMSKVMRCRPIFDNWSCTFNIDFLPDVLDEQQVRDIVDIAGKLVGVGDYRPKYGRFEVVA